MADNTAELPEIRISAQVNWDLAHRICQLPIVEGDTPNGFFVAGRKVVIDGAHSSPGDQFGREQLESLLCEHGV